MYGTSENYLVRGRARESFTFNNAESMVFGMVDDLTKNSYLVGFSLSNIGDLVISM
jgi:hypothetical protein